MKKMVYQYKKEYRPVYILAATLSILVIFLVVLFIYDKRKFDVDIPNQEYITNEMKVDTSRSLCSAKEKDEIFKKVNKVDFSYKPVEVVIGEAMDFDTKETVEAKSYVFNVNFKNITEDMYIRVTNDNDKTNQKEVLLKYENAKDGVITYQTEQSNEIVNYVVEIYTENKNCSDEMFRKFSFVTPIYNRYHTMDLCKTYKEFDLCQEFISVDFPSLDEFKRELYAWGKKEGIVITNLYEKHFGTTSIDSIDPSNIVSRETLSPEEIKENDKKYNKGKKEENVSNNVVYIIIGIGVVLVLITVIAVIIKKKRN